MLANYFDEIYKQTNNISRINIPKKYHTICDIQFSDIENIEYIYLLFNNEYIWEQKVNKNSVIIVPFTSEQPLFRYVLDFGDYYFEFSKIDTNKDISYTISMLGRIYHNIDINIKKKSFIHKNFFNGRSLIYKSNGTAQLSDL